MKRIGARARGGTRARAAWILAAALALACEAPTDRTGAPNAGGPSGAASAGAASPIGVPPGASPAAVVDSTAASAPDSAWVDVTGLTLVGFYPIVSNEQLERDADLATILDDFSYHLGTAMDSLTARGVQAYLRGGDTLWLRTGAERWRFVRPPDSADVGFVFADTLRRRAIVYGVRTYVDLVEHMDEFRRTGQIRPR